jgi:hypothetical protein
MGGCLNNQRGISRQDLYYSVLSKLLSDKKTDHQILLGNYLSYDQLPEQIRIFINRKKPNLIFLFIRPFPLVPLQKPFVRYEAGNHSVAYAIHPALFNRKMKWNDTLTKNQSAGEFQFVKKSVFGLRDINLLAGRFTGLQHWMLEYLVHQLEIVNKICTHEEIKLILISPPINPGSVMTNQLCKRTTEYLIKYCKREKPDLVNISSLSVYDFEQDKVHFNVSGHRKLAELICDYLTR